MCVNTGVWRAVDIVNKPSTHVVPSCFFLWPSHSRSLPLLINSSESVSSGVSMSSTLMSRSSGVSRKSSESTEPSLWSRERFMSGATRVRRFRWATDSPTFKEVGGSAEKDQVRLKAGKNKGEENLFKSGYIFHLRALLSVRPHESPSSGSGLWGKERKKKKHEQRLNHSNEFILALEVNLKEREGNKIMTFHEGGLLTNYKVWLCRIHARTS